MWSDVSHVPHCGAGGIHAASASQDFSLSPIVYRYIYV